MVSTVVDLFPCLRRAPAAVGGAPLRTFFWLVLSGGAWLVLIKLAPYFGIAPQWISLARSVYLGTFSVLLMVELRENSLSEQPAQVGALSGWLFVPALSIFGLWVTSPSLTFDRGLAVKLLCFYLLMLAILLLRARKRAMRMTSWDLLAPAALITLMMSPPGATALAAPVILVWLWRQHCTCDSATHTSQVADSLVMQLPSLCIAPVILILLRDVFEVQSGLDRADVEVAGMLINGLGSAAWTAWVVRSKLLARGATLVWLGGLALSLASSVTDHPLGVTLVSLLAAELLRGSVWLGITDVMSTARRWPGFAANVVATLLPLCSLLLLQRSVTPSIIMVLYASLHLAVPALLWVWHRRSDL